MLSTQELEWLRKAASKGDQRVLDELHIAFSEAMKRWQGFYGSLPGNWAWIHGWSIAGGDVELPAQATDIIASCVEKRHASVAAACLTWHRSRSTRHLPNPYEPLIDFLHHGGTWSRPENGVLDIYDGLGNQYAIPATLQMTEAVLRTKAFAALISTDPAERGVLSASMTADGVVRCPYCRRSFQPGSAKSWDGEVHKTCGTYLRISQS